MWKSMPILGIVLVCMPGCIRFHRAEVPTNTSQLLRKDSMQERPSPAIVEHASTLEELLPLLSDDNPIVRRTAAERLGEMKAQQAVKPLLELIQREKPLWELGYQTPTAAALISLGAIGGNEAKEGILRVLARILDQGPRRSNPIRDDEYLGILYASLDALRAWADDERVNAIATSLGEDGKWYGRIDWLAQRKAWEILLTGRLQAARGDSAAKRADWLISQLTGSGDGHLSDWARPGFKTVDAARNSAIVAMLTQYGLAILPQVRAAMAATPGGDTARREALQQLETRIKFADRQQRQTQ